jgi:hypothetical protein
MRLGRGLGRGHGLRDRTRSQGQPAGKNPLLEPVDRPPLRIGFLEKAVPVQGGAVGFGQFRRQPGNDAGGQNHELRLDGERPPQNRLRHRHRRTGLGRLDLRRAIRMIRNKDHACIPRPGERRLAETIGHDVPVQDENLGRRVFLLERQCVLQRRGAANAAAVIPRLPAGVGALDHHHQIQAPGLQASAGHPPLQLGLGQDRWADPVGMGSGGGLDAAGRQNDDAVG